MIENPSRHSMNCPDANAVFHFLNRKLDPAEASRIEAHMDECSDCRKLISALARSGEGAHETANLGPAPDEDGGTLPASLADTPAAVVAPGSSVGRYQILEPLGDGGMGEVYVAYDPELDRKIALKVLNRDALQVETARFRLLREAQAMARISHPNVMPVHDVGSHQGRIYIAMEHVDGQTVAQWLREPRPSEEILGIFLQAGRGLAAAHAAGLMHRDFKPENVLIGKNGVVRVTDFGLARASPPASTDATLIDPIPFAGRGPLEQALTRTGEFLGTPHYMAPEQFMAASVDARTDQFSFCSALYFALYREPPFPGDSVNALAIAVMQGRVRDAPRRPPVRPSLRRILLRGLSVKPADRFSSMDELLRRLEAEKGRARVRQLAGAATLVLLGAACLAVFASQARACSGSRPIPARMGIAEPSR